MDIVFSVGIPSLDRYYWLCYIDKRGILSMSDSSENKIPIPDEADNLDNLIDPQPASPRRGVLQVWQSIVKMGLGEMALRIGAGLASIALVLMVVWVMSTFYLKGNVKGPQTAAAVEIGRAAWR